MCGVGFSNDSRNQNKIQLSNCLRLKTRSDIDVKTVILKVQQIENKEDLSLHISHYRYNYLPRYISEK